MADNSSKKFKFISPGVFVDEIDNSQLPATPTEVGPVIIGRSRKGPGDKLKGRLILILILFKPLATLLPAMKVVTPGVRETTVRQLMLLTLLKHGFAITLL